MLTCSGIFLFFFPFKAKTRAVGIVCLSWGLVRNKEKVSSYCSSALQTRQVKGDVDGTQTHILSHNHA